MSEAPERIALRWIEGAAVSSGPLMDHPDYTRYVRADRIGELEERLKAAIDDAKEAEAYVEELEAKLAAGILEEYDDGSRILLSSYAGGAATGGAWSELTLLEEAQDGTVRLRSYTADGDWSATPPLQN